VAASRDGFQQPKLRRHAPFVLAEREFSFLRNEVITRITTSLAKVLNTLVKEDHNGGTRNSESRAQAELYFSKQGDVPTVEILVPARLTDRFRRRN